ncbi:hypothetical protein LguiA_034760 [Lonicera macranthoides]
MENDSTISVMDRSFVIPNSESKKRCIVEIQEKLELGHKRIKVLELESPFCNEGIDTHDPKSWNNGETAGLFESTEKEMSNITKETVTMNSNIAQSEGTGVDPLDFKSKKWTLSEKEIESNVNFVKSRGFGLDLNANEFSNSVNHDAFYPYKNNENMKPRDASECGSSIGPFEPGDPMRVWKEMKQNGFLSSSHGGVPAPKPRVRKIKNDGIKKKMELAKKEQVDRFAKIAAPSGLLNGLNPGIINHVRNSKQVHSIIEALVRSEKHENRQIQTKNGTKESSDPCHEDGSQNTLLGNTQIRRCHMRSELTKDNDDDDNDDSSMVERRGFGKTNCLSHFNREREDDKLAMKFSSSTNMASEITSSLTNEDSGNLTCVTSLSVKAANVAFQWLELLLQDIKGRLAALRRSKKRVQSVIQTELPFLLSREFASSQDNDLFVTKTCGAGCSDNPTAEVHRARWSSLFDQMEKALCEEEKQLESWLNQVKEMQLHCENGLFQYNGTQGQQQLGAFVNDYRSVKPDNSERDLAISAAAASIYSTCNFLQSMEDLPCF